MPLLASAVCATLIAWFLLWTQPKAQNLTQQDIDAAVLRTMDDKPLPSRAAKAAEMVRPAIVRVRGFNKPDPNAKDAKKTKPEILIPTKLYRKADGEATKFVAFRHVAQALLAE